MTAVTHLPNGFSLVEVLIATAVTATITALACGLAVEAQTAWRADDGRVDLQQRARVASDLVSRALLDAGGGPHTGPSKGSLLRVMAPVLPRRAGLRGAHAPDVFRPDTVTVFRARSEAEHAVLLAAAAAGAASLEIAPEPLCRQPSCGFSQGDSVMLHDSTGNYDMFTVTAVAGLTLSVRPLGAGTGVVYPAGSPVIAAESTTFFIHTATRTLRKYDGIASEMPLVDDVVGMTVEYFGAAQPPTRPRPSVGTANCLFDADGNYLAALMPVLGGGNTRLVPLTEETLTDGPWCGSGGNQFDADLLRVRRVRLTIRLQAADPAVRGTDRSRFAEPGTARRSGVMVPDVTVAADVAPRNLRQAW